MENIKKYWFLYTPLAALIIWGVSINSRIFESPEEKVEWGVQLKAMPTPAQTIRTHILDSVDKIHAKKSRNKRDSMYGVLINRMDYNDSIQLLNADQMFQIKEQLQNEQN
jgi:hypothetical protein